MKMKRLIDKFEQNKEPYYAELLNQEEEDLKAARARQQTEQLPQNKEKADSGN